MPNTYWIDSRLSAQRLAAPSLPAFLPLRELSSELIGTPAEVRRRGGIIPSWVIFGAIIVATFALCATVTMRTRSEKLVSAQQYQRIAAEVETLRKGNAAIGKDVRRLQTDPRTIESAARARLNMARANEIVVPIE
jgi:cell division protein FtsB